MYKKISLLSLAAMLLLISCKTKKEEKVEAGKFSVTTPLVMDTTFTKEYVAEIQSIQNIEIRAKVNGFLETIHADEGHQVSAGQTLFTIRPREYEAELQKAKAKVNTAELEMQNVKVLADKNIVSKSELALSVAKLNEAKAEQALAEVIVSYTNIVAPFSGTIDRLKIKTGSLVEEGELLTSLSNNREVYAYFNVSEVEYLDYKDRSKTPGNNQATLLLANGQPHKYQGQIETIEGEFDKNTGSIAFRAKFPNPDLLLKHGETGKVRLTMDLKQALVIPQKATYELQDKTYVYVVDANNVVRSRNVTIRQKLSNLYVIESGLLATDKILLEGTQNVKDDDKIEAEFIDARTVVSQYTKQ
jgi:membrane fusion protein (multidrug efflux system)